jgi:hypothetical protein
MVTIEETFDCVRMKNEIQARILAEEEGLSQEEITARRMARIEGDPVLGPWLRRVLEAQ